MSKSTATIMQALRSVVADLERELETEIESGEPPAHTLASFAIIPHYPSSVNDVAFLLGYHEGRYVEVPAGVVTPTFKKLLKSASGKVVYIQCPERCSVRIALKD